LDRTFHAIATILHRDPREAVGLRGKRRAGASRADDRESALRDFADGWIRVAL
jgi:hypothetical protein